MEKKRGEQTNLVRELDPDAITREGKSVWHINTAADERILSAVWRCVSRPFSQACAVGVQQ